ncbi:MAG: ribosome-binding factor A [bacterium]|nr:ribosome-binding factor A [bacterium]
MANAFKRHQRVESLILEELNKLILKELEFPGALVTLSGIDVQKDLDYSNVNVSVIPVQKSVDVLKILDASRRHLQHLLLRKINIRPMPEIRFKIDYGLEKAAEIERTFLEIEKEKNSK